MSFDCPHELKGECRRLKRACKPLQKGCVLQGRDECVRGWRPGDDEPQPPGSKRSAGKHPPRA